MQDTCCPIVKWFNCVAIVLFRYILTSREGAYVHL